MSARAALTPALPEPSCRTRFHNATTGQTPGVLEALEYWALAKPNAHFAVFWNKDGRPTRACTYAELHASSKRVAWHLAHSLRVAPGQRVVLAYPFGPQFIEAFIACVRIGAVPVPLPPPSPAGVSGAVRRCSAVIADCAPVAALTTASVLHQLSTVADASARVLGALPWSATDHVGESAECYEGIIRSDILFLQYTSGSTGSPRGVVVPQESLTNNWAATLDHVPITVSWLPQYHDMGLIGYYLFPLLSGGEAHWFSTNDFIRRPALWFKILTLAKATCTSAPNFGFQYCLREHKLPDSELAEVDLSAVRVFMNGSERVSTSTQESFWSRFGRYGLSRDALVASYGLAENTLVVSHRGRRSLHLNAPRLSAGEAVDQAAGESGVISVASCGSAVEGVKLTIAESSPAEGTFYGVPDRRVGEVLVGGSSVCGGYWNDAVATANVFGASVCSDGDVETGYVRTGDLGFMEGGELFICGRSKDAIIVRGVNHYSDDFENSALALSERFVRAAAVPGYSGDTVVLIIEVRSGVKRTRPADVAAAIARLHGLTPTEVLFTRPGAIPRTSSGKLERARTRLKWLAGEFAAEEPPFIASPNGLDLSWAGSAPARVRRLLEPFKVPELKHRRVADLGLDSLALMTLALDLNECRSLDSREGELDATLLQQLTVSETLGLLDRAVAASAEAPGMGRVLDKVPSLLYGTEAAGAMQSDARISVPGPTTRHVRPDSPGDVLLTGATGFFGPFLLHALLHQTTDTYYVLVRGADERGSRERLTRALKAAELWSGNVRGLMEDRVRIVCGDLGARRLGWSARQWRSLAESVGSVIHNGAVVNYVSSYSSLRPVNVLGTRELLRFSVAGRRKSFCLVSSTTVFGWTNRPDASEHEANPAMDDLDFGYAQTKWVAESLVLSACRQSMNGCIFRPSFISASTRSVASSDDIVLRLLAFMIHNRLAVNASNQMSLLPADIVANNIAAILGAGLNPSGVFNVTAHGYYSMMDITRLLTKNYGYSFQYLDLPEFVTEMKRRSRVGDSIYPLLGFFERSHRKIAAMQDKRYQNERYRAACDSSGRAIAEPALEDVVGFMRGAMKRMGTTA